MATTSLIWGRNGMAVRRNSNSMVGIHWFIPTRGDASIPTRGDMRLSVKRLTAPGADHGGAGPVAEGPRRPGPDGAAARPAARRERQHGGNRSPRGAASQQIMASVLRTVWQQHRDPLAATHFAGQTAGRMAFGLPVHGLDVGAAYA